MDELITDQEDMDVESSIREDPMNEEIEQQDAWEVITKYFKSKGLVGQQLDSFDEFVKNTIQVCEINYFKNKF